jgi:hypothetical protein
MIMSHQMYIALPDMQYQALAALAAQQGVSPESLAAAWLSERQQQELVQQVKTPLPRGVRQRYATLIERRDQHALTPQEHAELLQLTDQVELYDAKRAELLIALAELRHQPIDQIMQYLNIKALAHE